MSARARFGLFLKTIEAFGAHQLLEGTGELGGIVRVRRGSWHPTGVMVSAVRHGCVVRLVMGLGDRREVVQGQFGRPKLAG